MWPRPGPERPEALPEGVPRAGKVLRHRGFGGKLGFRRACAWGLVGCGLGVVLVGELGFWPLLGPSRPPISPQSPPQGPPITPPSLSLMALRRQVRGGQALQMQKGTCGASNCPFWGVSHAHVALFGSCLVVLCAFIREGLHMRMPFSAGSAEVGPPISARVRTVGRRAGGLALTAARVFASGPVGGWLGDAWGEVGGPVGGLRPSPPPKRSPMAPQGAVCRPCQKCVCVFLTED